MNLDEGPPSIPYEEWIRTKGPRKRKRRRIIKDHDITWRARYQPRQVWDLQGPSHLAASTLPEGFPEKLAFRALAAYAFLRTLSIELRLSPFTPNVFLRALHLPYPNKLMGQIHVALLRILLPNLGHGYCYRPRAGGVGVVKRRNGERFELRAGDNMTYLDPFTWPTFYDDYVHLSAELLHVCQKDTTNYVDFDVLDVREELERKEVAEDVAAAEAESSKLEGTRRSGLPARLAKRGLRRVLATTRKQMYSSESDAEDDDPEEQSDYELDEDDTNDDDYDLLGNYVLDDFSKPARPRGPRKCPGPSPQDTTIKRPRGRPRKQPLPSESTMQSRPNKRKLAPETATKRPGGRPRKQPAAPTRPPASSSGQKPTCPRVVSKVGLLPTTSYMRSQPAEVQTTTIVSSSTSTEHVTVLSTPKEHELPRQSCTEEKRSLPSDASDTNKEATSTKNDNGEKEKNQEDSARHQVSSNLTVPGTTVAMSPTPLQRLPYPPAPMYPTYSYPVARMLPYSPTPPTMTYPTVTLHPNLIPMQVAQLTTPSVPAAGLAQQAKNPTTTLTTQPTARETTATTKGQQKSLKEPGVSLQCTSGVSSVQETAQSALASHPATSNAQPIPSSQVTVMHVFPTSTASSLPVQATKGTKPSVDGVALSDTSTHPASTCGQSGACSASVYRAGAGGISQPSAPQDTTNARRAPSNQPSWPRQQPVQRPMTVPRYSVPKFALRKRQAPPSSPRKLSGVSKSVMSFVTNEAARAYDNGIMDEKDSVLGKNYPGRTPFEAEWKESSEHRNINTENAAQVSENERVGCDEAEGTERSHCSEFAGPSSGQNDARRISSDWPQFDAVEMMREGQPYHRLPMEQKVQILEFLIDELLCVEFIAEMFTDREAALAQQSTPYGPLPSQSEYETLDNADECSVCGLEGDLLCCDGCPGSYHRECIGMQHHEKLPEKWLCPDCQIGDSAKFGPLHAGKRASISWFNLLDLCKVGTGESSEMEEGIDREDRHTRGGPLVNADDVSPMLKSVDLLIVHGFVFTRRRGAPERASGVTMFDRLQSSHFDMGLMDQNRLFSTLRQMGSSVLSSWPICQIPFEPNKLGLEEWRGQFIVPAIFLMLHNGRFNPSNYENVYRSAPALRVFAKHSSLAYVDFETECAVTDTRAFTGFVQPDVSFDQCLSVALRTGRSLFDPHKMVSSYLVALELTLKRGFLLDEFWGTKNEKVAGVWALNATRCRSIQRFAALALKLVDGIHRRAFVDDWHGPPSGRVKNDLDSVGPSNQHFRSVGSVFNPLTSDWTPESEKRNQRWESASLSDVATLLTEEGSARGPKRPRKQKAAKRKDDSEAPLAELPRTDQEAEWNFDGQKTNSAIIDALYTMAGSTPASNAENEGGPQRWSRRGSRRSTRKRSRADYSDYGEFEAPDSAAQLKESKRRKLSEFASELSSSFSTPEATWPVAGRRLFEPAGYLPAAEMRRLGRNAGIVRAASVTYSKTYEVGQPAVYHVWRKHAMRCTTYEGLFGLLRVLEAHLDRSTMNTCESLAQRSRCQKSGLSTVILCSQKELSTGSTYHFVVHSEKRRGCWFAEDSIGLPVLTVEYERRSRRRQQSFQTMTGTEAGAVDRTRVKRDSTHLRTRPPVSSPSATVQSLVPSATREPQTTSREGQAKRSMTPTAYLTLPQHDPVPKQSSREPTVMMKLKQRVDKISLRHQHETTHLLRQCMELGIKDVPVSQMKLIRNETAQRFQECRQEFADATTSLSLDAIYEVITTAEVKAQDDVRSERLRRGEEEFGDQRQATLIGRSTTRAPPAFDSASFLQRRTAAQVSPSAAIAMTAQESSALPVDSLTMVASRPRPSASFIRRASLLSQSALQGSGLGVCANSRGIDRLGHHDIETLSAFVASASLQRRQAEVLSPSMASQATPLTGSVVAARHDQKTTSLLASIGGKNDATQAMQLTHHLNVSNGSGRGMSQHQHMSLALREERALQASMNALQRQRERTAATRRQQARVSREQETAWQATSALSFNRHTTWGAPSTNPIDEIMKKHQRRFFG